MLEPKPVVYEVLVSLDDVTTCERRLRVSSGATLARLNRVLCAALDWPSDLPYAFTAAGLRWEGAWTARGRPNEVIDVRLRQVLPDAGSVMSWEYGRDTIWDARVQLHALHAANDLLETPCCVSAIGRSPNVSGDPWENEGADVSPRARSDVTLLLNAINAALRDTRNGKREMKGRHTWEARNEIGHSRRRG